MSLKFANKKKLALYVFLACISACGNVVIAYVTKIMLNSAQYHRGSLKQLILIAALGAALLIVIMFLNFAYRYLRSDITRDINLKLKEKTITYLVAQQNDSQKDGLNLMTNDLKQIESLKITNELMIISEIAAFAISIFVGLINSWLLTIISLLLQLFLVLFKSFLLRIFKINLLSGKNKMLNILKPQLMQLMDQKQPCCMTHRFLLFLMSSSRRNKWRMH